MNHTFNIIGIDPGTNTGIAVYTIDTNFNILNIDTYTILLNNYVNEDNTVLGKDSERYLVLGNLIEELLEKYNPIAIALESAFINKKFMGSGMKVMGYISVILYVIKKFNPNILLCKLAPKSVKKKAGDATANKDKMKELVNETILQYIDIEKESEHSIDAISIGYSLLNLIKNSPYLLKFG